MRRQFTVAFCLLTIKLLGQAPERLVIRGDYTASDSIQITNAYLLALEAVRRMHHRAEQMWQTDDSMEMSMKQQRKANWEADLSFSKWLGNSRKIGVVYRKINRIYNRFDKRMILEVSKKNRGRCTGWISAWTIPYGRVKIKLCEDYFIYRTHLQEKVLIHEMGHEIGMLSHHKIHGCRAAIRAASTSKSSAKRSPENYAWLAMSYMGLSCAQ